MSEQEPKHYVRTMKAWYAKSVKEVMGDDWTDEIYFYNDEPYGEMAVRWYQFDEACPRLEVFVQSAYALASLIDVLAGLAHWSASGSHMSPDDFCQLLEECGFVDKTPYRYEDSYPNREVPA
jgi:hypothetical protein